jgi:hypothetical protein
MPPTPPTYPTLAEALIAWFHHGDLDAHATCVTMLTPRIRKALASVSSDWIEDHVQDFLVAKLDRERGLLDPTRASDFGRYLSRTLSNFRRDVERQRNGRLCHETAMPEGTEAVDACCPQRRLESRDALRRTLLALDEAPVGARVAWLLTTRIQDVGHDITPHVRELASSLGEDEDAVLTRAATAMESGALADAIRVLVPGYDGTDPAADPAGESFARQARRGRAVLRRAGAGSRPWTPASAA